MKSAALASIPFLIWDKIFTDIGVWGFNESYTLGINILSLPIEEILFFIFIPFALIILWEASQYFKVYKFFKLDKNFYNLVDFISILLFFLNVGLIYTNLAAFSVFVVNQIAKKQNIIYRKNIIFLFFVSIIPFFIVNGLLTSLPVVWYDTAYKTNINFITIPIEDLFFSYSLITLNAIIYEKIKARHTA